MKLIFLVFRPEEIGLRTVKQWIRSQPVVMLPQSLEGLNKFICSLKIKIQVQPPRLLDEGISNGMLGNTPSPLSLEHPFLQSASCFTRLCLAAPPS